MTHLLLRAAGSPRPLPAARIWPGPLAALLLLVLVLPLAAGAQETAPSDGGPRAAAEPPPTSEPPIDRGSGELEDAALNLFSLMWQSRWFMLPIGLMSLIVVAVTVERFISMRSSRVMPSALMRQLGKMQEASSLDPRRAYRLCQEHPSAAASVIKAMLMRVGRPQDEIVHAVEEASQREADKMQANVRWLRLAAAVSPLMGLFGTVWGMIYAFHETTTMLPGQNKADHLAEGIYLALVTTLAGLVVAIPAVVIAYYFEGRIESIFRRIDEMLFHLTPQVERFEGRVRLGAAGDDGAAPVAPSTGSAVAPPRQAPAPAPAPNSSPPPPRERDAMAVKIHRSTTLEAMSMTPLIDVVFLLLIFFLVATRFAEEDRELDVVLPTASEAQPLTAEPKELFVGIDQQGRYFVDGKELALEEVNAAIRRAAVNNPLNQSVIIRADKRVALDFPCQVMNLCNRHGIRDYTLTTEANSRPQGIPWPKFAASFDESHALATSSTSINGRSTSRCWCWPASWWVRRSLTNGSMIPVGPTTPGPPSWRAVAGRRHAGRAALRGSSLDATNHATRAGGQLVNALAVCAGHSSSSAVQPSRRREGRQRNRAARGRGPRIPSR